jgi:hypothetical protein
VLAHVFRQHTHTNTGEVIDRETGVTRVLCWEQTLEAGPQNLVSETGLQARKTKVLGEILEQNLDEDTATGRGLFLVHMDYGQNVPANGVIAEHVSEKPCDVPQAIRLVAVDSVVVLGECGLKQVRPETVNLGKPFSNQAVELGVCPFLGATLDNHGRQFRLHAGREIDLHQLVTAFFKVNTRHDCEVDCSPKIDQVSVGLILNIHLLFLGIRFILGALIPVLIVFILIAVLTENLGL